MPPVWPSLCPGSEHGTPPNNLCGHNLFTPNFQDRDTNLLQKTKDFFIQPSFRARLFRDPESLRSQDTGPCLALREVSVLSCIVPKISLLQPKSNSPTLLRAFSRGWWVCWESARDSDFRKCHFTGISLDYAALLYLVLEITVLFTIADVRLQKKKGKSLFVQKKTHLSLEQKSCQF